MQIELRTFKLSRTSWVHPILDEYQKKISRFQPYTWKNLKDQKVGLRNIGDLDIVVSIDEKGLSLNSLEFSQKIQHFCESGKNRLCFVVGGPFGLQSELLDRANHSICLSPFVMSQEIALSVFSEQLFRAFTIINNFPYHNE